MPLANSAGGAAAGIGAIIFIIIGLAFYLVPGIVASARHVPNQGSVWIINVLLGWTLVGWAVALAMACRSKYQAVMTPYGPGPQMFGQQPPGFRPPPPPVQQPPMHFGDPRWTPPMPQRGQQSPQYGIGPETPPGERPAPGPSMPL